MNAKNIASVTFVFAALAAAGYMVFATYFRPTPASLRVVDHFCLSPTCGVEFSLEQGEIDRRMRAREPVTCSKCGTDQTERGYRCGSCNKLNKAVGHGSPPMNCAFCKKTWTDAPLTK